MEGNQSVGILIANFIFEYVSIWHTFKWKYSQIYDLFLLKAELLDFSCSCFFCNEIIFLDTNLKLISRQILTHAMALKCTKIHFSNNGLFDTSKPIEELI